jgi:REP element-mobilizing transposase RayT
VAASSYTFLAVHAVWATKHRAAVLSSAYDPWLEREAQRAMVDHRCRLLAFGAAPDHVHVVLNLASTACLAAVLKTLKGRTGRIGNASSRPISWQNGYWAETWSPDRLPRLVAYVTNQRRHHQPGIPPERWELVTP